MARKIAVTSPDSSLSPPPEDMSTTPPNDSAATHTQTNSRKRKAKTTVKETKRVRKSAMDEVALVAADEVEQQSGQESTTPPKKRARKVKVEEKIMEETRVESTENGVAVTTKQKTQRKRKGEDLAPLQARTIDSCLRVGAHVSISGGVHNSIGNVIHIGANAFALFLKNQRKWENPGLNPEHATSFLEGCKTHDISAAECCLPHGSYLVNLAHPDTERKKQAYDSFLDDLKRCNTLGIRLYNFHPGNSSATTKEEGIKLIAEAINKAHNDPEIGSVVPVLETMAALGNTIGGTFEDIAGIIEHVEDKTRVGVCLDTCHVFAAGYDLRTPKAYAETMRRFDDVIGLGYLKALHMNDSKAPLGSHRDLHAQIGTGYLGLRAFHNIVNDERLQGLPMVLETPIDEKNEDGKKIEDKGVWAREIKMLEQLVGMDTESEQFKTWEKDLSVKGLDERERVGGQVKRKQEKDATPKKKRKAKNVPEELEDNSDDD